MYNFHYKFMVRKFNARLLFTDTDSLCYEILVNITAAIMKK